MAQQSSPFIQLHRHNSQRWVPCEHKTLLLPLHCRQPLVSCCAGWCATGMPLHWSSVRAEMRLTEKCSHREKNIDPTTSTPSTWASNFQTLTSWRMLTEEERLLHSLHCLDETDDQSNISHQNQTNKRNQSCHLQMKPQQSSPEKLSFPSQRAWGVCSQLQPQWTDALEHKTWLSLLANVARNKHGPAIFSRSGYSFWLTSWNNVFHRMTTH